jgi:hypothetical protein
MQKEAVRNDVRLFANAVHSLGYSRNVGTGKVVPLPPDADDTVATYKHAATGRKVCVWPIDNVDDATEVGVIADRHGFRFVQFGRPQPKTDATTEAAS